MNAPDAETDPLPGGGSETDDPAPALGVDKSGRRVREMFRQIAPKYDRMNHLLSLNIDRYWRSQAVKSLQLDPTGRSPILDVCCGTGDLAIAMADQAGAVRHVVGTDFCGAMLKIALEKEAARWRDTQGGAGRPVIPFLEADALRLPFPENQFAYVTVAFGLRNVADTDRGLQEMIRVCRPGGKVMILEFSQPTVPVLRQTYQFYFRHVLPRVGQWMARNDKSAYKYLPESVGEFPSGLALVQRMRAAGLETVTHTPLTLGVATIYCGQKPGGSEDRAPRGQQADAVPTRDDAIAAVSV